MRGEESIITGGVLKSDASEQRLGKGNALK